MIFEQMCRFLLSKAFVYLFIRYIFSIIKAKKQSGSKLCPLDDFFGHKHLLYSKKTSIILLNLLNNKEAFFKKLKFKRASLLSNNQRGVAQSGRALSSGGKGRRFKSSHPDQIFF
jgi:hypothetical protein